MLRCTADLLKERDVAIIFRRVGPRHQEIKAAALLHPPPREDVVLAVWKSRAKSCRADTTTMRSMSLGVGTAVTKLPSTTRASIHAYALASRTNARNFAHNCGRRSVR